MNEERFPFVCCWAAYLSGARGRTDAVYPYSLPLHSSSMPADPLTAYNLTHQSLFLRSRCFPMSAGPLTKQNGESSSLKVLHMSLPSLLSFPLLTPTFWDPMGSLSRVQSWWWENIFWSILVFVFWTKMKKYPGVTHGREQKAVSYYIFAVGLMTHLSSTMDQDPGTPYEKDTNGRW